MKPIVIDLDKIILKIKDFLKPTNLFSGLKEIFFYQKEIYKKYKFIFLWIMFIGLLSHGMALTNKYSYHDDATALFGIGGTHQIGRWMLHYYKEFHNLFFGNIITSIPLINGFLSLIFISLAIVLILDLFNIKSKILSILFGGISISIPTVCGIFAYMFTAPYYFFSMFIGIFGIWLICKYRNFLSFFLAIILISCSLGGYQAYLSLFLGILLIYSINIIAIDQIQTKEFFKFSAYALFSILTFMSIYVIAVKLSLHYYDASLINYAGLDKMAQNSFMIYLKRLFLAYKEFISPAKTLLVFPNNSIYIYYFTLIIFSFLTIILFIKIFLKQKLKAIFFLILVMAIPLGVNFIFLMTHNYAIHALMFHGSILIFLYLIMLIDNINIIIKNNFFIKIVKNISILNLICLIAMYIKFSNSAYLKAEFLQSQTISYFTTLVTQIKSTPNYKDEFPVTIINNHKIKDKSFNNLYELNFITTTGYHSNIINNYAWQKFVRNWIGYSPKYINSKEFENIYEVKNMPHYPDYGSIKVINDTIVIKF